MELLAGYIHEISELVHQHVPSEVIPPAMPTGVLALVFGVGICVLGAKLARWFITILFAVAGLVLGLSVSRAFGLSPELAALVSAATPSPM